MRIFPGAVIIKPAIWQVLLFWLGELHYYPANELDLGDLKTESECAGNE